MDYLRATIDDEMGKIGPSPAGCGANRSILRCHPRRWTRHSLRIPPRLDQFSSATPPARKLITGSRPKSLDCWAGGSQGELEQAGRKTFGARAR
jgi:hypothetical protein